MKSFALAGAALASLLFFAGCGNGPESGGPAAPSRYGNPQVTVPVPVVVTYAIFQPTVITPPAGSKITINEHPSTYEEYLSSQVHLEGTFTLKEEDLPACVALLYVREFGADSVVVGGASSEFRDKPAGPDRYEVTHFLSEDFFGSRGRGHEINALFLVGKPGPDVGCGNRMLVQKPYPEYQPWPYRDYIRWENVAKSQIIPVRYTIAD